jgi:hypothetical protein
LDGRVGRRRCTPKRAGKPGCDQNRFCRSTPDGFAPRRYDALTKLTEFYPCLVKRAYLMAGNDIYAFVQFDRCTIFDASAI